MGQLVASSMDICKRLAGLVIAREHLFRIYSDCREYCVSGNCSRLRMVGSNFVWDLSGSLFLYVRCSHC